jgi:hypothetical protein
MTTFAEQLTTLTDAELDKLERILLMLQNNVFDGDFDELLQKMRIQSVILSPTDADLIGSRIYELEIFQNLHPADARKLALEDFNAGKLHPKPKSIPRYKGSQSYTCQYPGRCRLGIHPRPGGVTHSTASRAYNYCYCYNHTTIARQCHSAAAGPLLLKVLQLTTR